MVRFLILLVVLGGIVAAAYTPVTSYLAERNKPDFETSEAAERTVTLVVNSTGEVKPVLSVAIGSFVSGPITELHVDFNDRVTEGQLLAEIDPRIYDAAVARDEATLATRKSEIKRAEAQLQQAVNDELRSIALRDESPDYISQTEIDQFHFAKMSLEAQLEVAKAAVKQAEATLENSEANLGYTKILSPVDGIVIDRKIDPGQTLAAQFQTPELFVIAPNMEQTMHIFASVDEADIGLIRKAQEEGQPVKFTVDAYPDDLFEGKVEQIRFSSTEEQNVVTYPVVVSAPNPELKLLPGMTADLSFTIEVREDVLCVPNTALRFFPTNKQWVREADRDLLDGAAKEKAEGEELPAGASAEQKVAADRARAKRHVWVESPDGLRAIEVTMGISDNRYTEILTGEVTAKQDLVTELKR